MALNFYIFQIKATEISNSVLIGIIQNNTTFIARYALNDLPEFVKQIMQNDSKRYEISINTWNHLVYHSTIQNFDFENNRELQFYLSHPFEKYF
jgi:hypothetical protein